MLVRKENIVSFKIGEIEGQGLLTPFNWKHGDEKTKVKIRWIKGMYTSINFTLYFTKILNKMLISKRWCKSEKVV